MNSEMMSCRDCGADVDHCHGALIVHSDGHTECTDGGCGVFLDTRHSLVMDCDSLGKCRCSAEAERLAS